MGLGTDTGQLEGWLVKLPNKWCTDGCGPRFVCVSAPLSSGWPFAWLQDAMDSILVITSQIRKRVSIGVEDLSQITPSRVPSCNIVQSHAICQAENNHWQREWDDQDPFTQIMICSWAWRWWPSPTKDKKVKIESNKIKIWLWRRNISSIDFNQTILPYFHTPTPTPCPSYFKLCYWRLTESQA